MKKSNYLTVRMKKEAEEIAMRFAKVFVLLFLALWISSSSAMAAQPGAKSSYDEKAVADFYRGKTVRIIVGFSAGGGYDQYSRLIARHMSKYIPGNPGRNRRQYARRREHYRGKSYFQRSAQRRHRYRQHFRTDCSRSNSLAVRRSSSTWPNFATLRCR